MVKAATDGVDMQIYRVIGEIVYRALFYSYHEPAPAMIGTGDEYKDSICDDREVYVNGGKVKDVTPFRPSSRSLLTFILGWSAAYYKEVGQFIRKCS